MQVKTEGRVCLDARARAEAIDDLLFHDYYSRTPRLRLTGESQADGATEIVLEDNDIARVVECALQHPSLNMRQVVLTAIWNDPAAFRDIFRFGLRAPEPFPEIRRIVAEELERHAAASPAVADAAKPAAGLLPLMPLPAHLQRRAGRKTGQRE